MLPRSLDQRLKVRCSSAIKLLCFCVPLWFIITGSLSAITLQVAIDGSQPYTTIQSAIDASVNGDMVLVHPGRYYENVVYGGKIITLCSLEATTSDSTYISSTIIDGNNAGSCVRFYNQEQGAALRGFTLEHGIGYPFGAQNDRSGGGIFVYNNCTVTITNCIIKNNLSTMGGGLFAFEASLNLSGIKIHHNQASASGGGVLLWSSRTVIPNIVFDQANLCSIYENYSTNPCDVYVIDIMANLDIYLDMVSVPNPGDFYFGRHANFTQTQGYTDTVHYLQPYRREANRDLYVRPDGDDSNSGFSPAEAMKTIAKAVHKIAADSTNIKTVHILPGTYTSDDQLYPPIPLRSFVNIAGAGPDSTFLTVTSNIIGIINLVISGVSNKNAGIRGIKITSTVYFPIFPIRINGYSSHTSISNIEISNAVIGYLGSMMLLGPTDTYLIKVKVTDISTTEIGGIYSSDWISGSVIDCEFSNITSVFNDPSGREPMTMFDVDVNESITVQNCVFRDFYTAPEQPAFNISNGRSDNGPIDVNISNCLFSNLNSDIYRPILFSNRSIDSFKLTNNTFINNHGWPSAVSLIGNIQLQNNIFYNPECNYEFSVINSPPIVPVSNIYLDYNNIRNGSGGILSSAANNIYYADTNISQYPEFYSLHPENPLYAALSANSPCINTATPDTTGLGLLPYDLAGNHRVWGGRIDMGCYEYGSAPYVSNTDPFIVPPLSEMLISIYPNPFTDHVNIRYHLTKAAKVTLQIYNLKGQLVKTLISESQSKGEQLAMWEGCDEAGRHLASGIYFLRLNIDGKPEKPRRLVLLK